MKGSRLRSVRHDRPQSFVFSPHKPRTPQSDRPRLLLQANKAAISLIKPSDMTIKKQPTVKRNASYKLCKQVISIPSGPSSQVTSPRCQRHTPSYSIDSGRQALKRVRNGPKSDFPEYIREKYHNATMEIAHKARDGRKQAWSVERALRYASFCHSTQSPDDQHKSFAHTPGELTKFSSKGIVQSRSNLHSRRYQTVSRNNRRYVKLRPEMYNIY